MNPFFIKIKHYFVILALTISILGCSKSDHKVGCHAGFNLYEVSSGELASFSDAAIDYAQDPTPVNCNKYKKAISAYIDVLERYEKCALEYGDTQDWKESIREAREDIKDLQCQ